MKKKRKFLSLLLCLCMAALLLPAAAFADNVSYGLWVNGIEVNPDNAQDILGKHPELKRRKSREHIQPGHISGRYICRRRN